ncbi:MAG: hypothetical protein V3T77_06975 [Planctomycetota bacterium]
MKQLALFIALCTVGCTISRAAERAYLRGEEGRAVELFQDRAQEAVGNYALEESLLGTAALTAGDYRTAREALIEAGRVMGSFPGNSPKQVGALIGRESNKVYLGDPYEVAMNSLYSALLLLAKGDEENARAALKQGILADSDSKEERYKSDNLALYLLEAFLSLRDGKSDLARRDLEQVLALDPDNEFASPSLLQNANTVILIDVGKGPRKVGAGKFGELARFQVYYPLPYRSLLTLNGEPLQRPSLGVDVAFQAMTRGGRDMEGVLRGKAAFKETTETSGFILLDQATRMHKHGGVLALIGGGLLLLSALIQPQADLRHWHLLPGESHLWIGRIPAGLHTLQLDFTTYNGGQLPAFQQIWHYLPFREEGLNVYYFRAAPMKGFRRRVTHDSASHYSDERLGP